MRVDGSKSFYFFDIDDNLLFLPTQLYLWNAVRSVEQAVTSGQFASIQHELGRSGKWQEWNVRPDTFRDFRDRSGVSAKDQSFVTELKAAIAHGTAWQGPSWPLLVHAARWQRPIAMVTARGHSPETIKAGLQALVDANLLPQMPVIIDIYTVTNEEVRQKLGASDPATTVPSIKKLAIKAAVDAAVETYGASWPHRFGMSDDDPNNVVLAISAMRDCKLKYPEKRFFVINSNHQEFVKLEIFAMDHPVTKSTPQALLQESLVRANGSGSPDAAAATHIAGGNASVYVNDMDRAVKFYTQRLGLRLSVRIGDEWAELDAGKGFTIGLHPVQPIGIAAGTAGAINIELNVSAPLETVLAELKRRGVTVDGAIADYENVRITSILDPDKNAIVLAQVLHSGPDK